MNRKQFLKRLGIGAVAVVVAPKVITEAINPESKLRTMVGMWFPKRRRAGKAALAWAEDVSKFQKYYAACDIAVENSRPLYFVRLDECGHTVEVKRLDRS